jgi:uncharacterized protein YndB with AHSA1/START domain
MRDGEDNMTVETTDDNIHIELDFAVPPMRAWTMLTEQQHIAAWWGEHVQLQARPGGTLRETWSDGARQVITSGQVTRCDPPAALELSWADDDWPGETRVAFHLAGHGDGTRLVLDHSGWGVHPADRRSDLIGAHASGWSQYLARLAEYATEVRPSEREA